MTLIRLTQQLAFLNEIEKLKLIYRRNRTVDRTRFENSAEHSWHLAVMALLLAEHANTPLDLFKVVKMLLIHDLVEIYAGDTWLYDPEANASQAEREQDSAAKLFGLLPTDQAEAFTQLWLEFEARQTPEAQYAAALDALQPLANHLISGDPNEEPRPQVEQVIARKRHIAQSAPALWEAAQQLIEQSKQAGLYP